MRVTTTFRAPDEGEDVVVLTCDTDGEIGHLGRLQREHLAYLLPLLREGVGRLGETGHPDGQTVEAQITLLAWLEGLVADGTVVDPGVENAPDHLADALTENASLRDAFESLWREVHDNERCHPHGPNV